jgi:hypothetical protein
VYDPKGKIAGRGAYICARAECIAIAQKQKRLDKALRVSGIEPALFETLAAVAQATAVAGGVEKVDAGASEPAITSELGNRSTE